MPPNGFLITEVVFKKTQSIYIPIAHFTKPISLLL